jgi:hypothetical protein
MRMWCDFCDKYVDYFEMTSHFHCNDCTRLLGFRWYDDGLPYKYADTYPKLTLVQVKTID